MIREITQYRFICDGCSKSSGCHHDPAKLLGELLKEGWEGGPGPPDAPRRLWRCPKCVGAGTEPDGWREPA